MPFFEELRSFVCLNKPYNFQGHSETVLLVDMYCGWNYS